MRWQGRRQSTNVEMAPGPTRLTAAVDAALRDIAMDRARNAQSMRGMNSVGLFAPGPIASLPPDPITGAMNYARMNVPGNYRDTIGHLVGRRESLAPQGGLAPKGAYGAGLLSPNPNGTYGMLGGQGLLSAPSVPGGFLGGLFSGLFGGRDSGKSDKSKSK